MKVRSNKLLIVPVAATVLVAVLLQSVHWGKQAGAIAVSARITDQSTAVAPADRVYYDVEIKYPENTARKDLRVTTEIKQKGQVIATAKSLRAVETQISFLDYIVVPEGTASGPAELDISISDYQNLHEEVSATFQVTKGNAQEQQYFFILLGAIVFIGVLVSIQIFFLARKRSVKT